MKLSLLGIILIISSCATNVPYCDRYGKPMGCIHSNITIEWNDGTRYVEQNGVMVKER